MRTVLIVVISTILIMSLYLVDIHDMHSSTVKFPVSGDVPFAHYDSFGLSFTTTVNGDWFAGFWGSDIGGTNAGYAYLIDGAIMNPLVPILDVNSANGTSENNEDGVLLTINNPTPDAYDYFGGSITSTHGGDLFVGAHGDNTGGNDAGSAYLFDGTSGDLLFEINNPEPADEDYFGWSVASTPNGDLFVGAYGDNTGGNNAGSAYLFDGTSGDLLFEINNPEPAEWDYFGWSVASTINGDLLVGAPSDNVGGNNAGSAYLFDGTSGNLLAEINNPESDLYNYFGYSVASTTYGDPIISAVNRNGTAINVANSTASYIFASSNDDDTTTITTELPIILYDPTPKLSKFFIPFIVSIHSNGNSASDDDGSKN